MSELEKKVCEMIVRRLGLNDLNVDEIDCNAPLFKAYDENMNENSLGLDSVDALELVVGLREEFQANVTDEDMYIFESISKIAEYLEKQSADKEDQPV